MNVGNSSHPASAVRQKALTFYSVGTVGIRLSQERVSVGMKPRTPLASSQSAPRAASPPPLPQLQSSSTPLPSPPLSSLQPPIQTNSITVTTSHPDITYPLSEDKVNIVAVEPDQQDIDYSTDSNSTPTTPGPHPSVTDFDVGSNHRPTKNPNSVSTEASATIPRARTPVATKATSANANPRVKAGAIKSNCGVQLQKFESEMFDFLNGTFQAVTSFADGSRKQILEHQSTIEILEEEVRSLNRRIWQLQTSEEEAIALLESEQNNVTQLQRDIAKLSLGVPQGTKDDHYFTAKFTEIFLSIHDWVFQRFFVTNFEQLSVGLRSESVFPHLHRLFHVVCTDDLSKHPLYMIEALVGRVIAQSLFTTALPGSSIHKILQFMRDSSASSQEVTHWRLQTTRMVMSSNRFRSLLLQRLDNLGNDIDNMLAPLGEPGPKSSKRLRGIIENAANLAMDCQQQPAKFSLISFDPGNDCSKDQMCDVLGEIADNKLASGGAFVGLTVSPMVVRDKKITLVKARVLRQLPAEDLL